MIWNCSRDILQEGSNYMRLNKQNCLYQEDLDNIMNFKGIEALKGKSVLITGATGLIGTCLIDALMKYNAECDAEVKVFAVGRSKEKAAGRLGEYYENKLFNFIEQDARTPFPDDLIVDYIIPLASNTHPMAYSKFPVETIEINVKGAENALQFAARSGAVVVYPSSVEIYGNGNEDFDENHTGKLDLSTSRSCYTESKRVSEAMCQSYSAEFGVDCRIARLSRVFGPTMNMNDSKASSQFILKALAREDIVLKSKGDQLFSYTYVADAVQALLFIMLYGERGQAYNVASDACNVRLSVFAESCAQYAGTKVIFDVPDSVEQRGYSIATRAVMATDKLKELGWSANYDFATAINRTMTILDDK